MAKDRLNVENNHKEKVVDATVTSAVSAPKDKKQEQLDELFTYLKTGSGYLITVTTISNGRLNHHLVTQDFPEIDILKSLAATEKLAVERLKKL